MKTNFSLKCISVLAVISSIGTVASAATLSSGSATIDFDKTAWDGLAAAYGSAPVLTLNAFFNQADVTSRTYSQILSGAAPGTPSYIGQIYAMNGATVTNLTDAPNPSRTNQPTTFDFTAGNPTGHTGAIGLGGISRFSVSTGGGLVFGDYTLQYSASRIPLGGTGWYLKGNITPAAAAFDLLNVNVTETPTSLSISGDLGVTYEIANFLYATPADAGKDVGNFAFSATVVPEPTALALLGVGGIALLRRRRNLSV